MCERSTREKALEAMRQTARLSAGTWQPTTGLMRTRSVGGLYDMTADLGVLWSSFFRRVREPQGALARRGITPEPEADRGPVRSLQPAEVYR